MSETIPTPADIAPKATEGEQPEQDGKTFDAEYVERLRKEAAKYRTEAKANADAARRLEEMEQQNLSELEKAKRATEAAEKRAHDLEMANLRQSVIITKGLSAELGERLRGETREEMEADADVLKALVNAPRQMQPDYSQGAQPPAPTTPEQEFLAFTSKF